MADTAAHLVDRVLPCAPYRQWVFTVPKPLRLVLAREPTWTSWIGGVVVRAIGAWQRRVARKRGIHTPLTGAVTFVQRFGGLVNLNVHFHLVVPDGVFADDGTGLRFEMLAVPTNADVLAILDRIMRRIARRFAPVGAGVTLTGPGGDGHLSVVTPMSPIGRAVLGKKEGDVVDITVEGDVREWAITYVG